FERRLRLVDAASDLALTPSRGVDRLAGGGPLLLGRLHLGTRGRRRPVSGQLPSADRAVVPRGAAGPGGRRRVGDQRGAPCRFGGLERRFGLRDAGGGFVPRLLGTSDLFLGGRELLTERCDCV